MSNPHPKPVQEPEEVWSAEEDQYETDPFVTVFPSRSRSVAQRNPSTPSLLDERAPLLGAPPRPRKKFFRPRPLWLVPFAITTALVRGMTLAPRVEVYTQLACAQIQQQTNQAMDSAFHPTTVRVHGDSALPVALDYRGAAPPTKQRCTSDPAVAARIAWIQTAYSTIMGVLSAVTTGWWGQLSERYGRTTVLAISSFGWLVTDVIFIMISNDSFPLYAHGNILILIAPIFEGFLGGWSSLQSGTSSYISDCTSSGSRASIFSRFTGVSFLGFSVGPIIGGWLIRHPLPWLEGVTHPRQIPGHAVNSVFWVSAAGSLFNLLYILFITPESLRRGATSTIEAEIEADSGTSSASPQSFNPLKLVGSVSAPLAIFLPVRIPVDQSSRKRLDWSLTFLVLVMFMFMLCTGLFQIKYLYGRTIYGWDAEQLSYYISLMGGGRAVFLLVFFPYIISRFKPKSPPKTVIGADGQIERVKPTKGHLAKEMKFDLRLVRMSLFIDMLSNVAVILSPAPSYLQHIAADDPQFRKSQAMFVMSTWIGSWGAGLPPAIHSLSLSIVQSRALLEEEAGSAVVDAPVGRLFGAYAVLQALGQMIIGPILFGLIYSKTVGTYPKAIFASSACLTAIGLLLSVFFRNPLLDIKGKRRALPRQRAADLPRGRSRGTKDLRSGSESSSTSETEESEAWRG